MIKNKSKRFFTGLLACLCLMSVGVYSQKKSGKTESADAEAIRNEILRLEEAGRQKVLKGDNDWDEFFSEGAYMIGPDGSVIVYEKGKTLPSFPVRSFKMKEMIVRVYGEVAVVSGLAEVEGESPDKKLISAQMRFINVWKKTGDSWKLVVTGRMGVKGSVKGSK